ncbi:hypothetical protein [Streptosporangium sandarakinum]|uniref:hypothetical protein n=1 Tax=Streptosporangium sandarakinum TaxID=1260955 RepID=UPI00343E83B1
MTGGPAPAEFAERPRARAADLDLLTGELPGRRRWRAVGARVVTTGLGDQAAIVMRRVKSGEPVLHAFIWRVPDGWPTVILREITFGRGIGHLPRPTRRRRDPTGADS